MQYHFTTREIADRLGGRTWQVRRLFEDGTLPEPGKFCGRRAIPAEMLGPIADAMRKRHWLPETEGATAQ